MDKEFILKYLDRNHDVIANSFSGGFDVINKVDELQEQEYLQYSSGQRDTVINFHAKFIKIFGEFFTEDGTPSTDIYREWVEAKKAIITKELDEFLATVDFEIGSIEIFEKVATMFQNNRRLPLKFVHSFVNGYYVDKILTPKILVTLTELDTTKPSSVLINELSIIFNRDGDEHKRIVITKFEEYYKHNGTKVKVDNYVAAIDKGLGCSEVIVNFNEKYKEETPKQIEYATYFLNRWYSENILGSKVTDFLSQCVVTPGNNEWRVTWIGHGKLTRSILRNQFKDENKEQIDYLMEIYDNWFNNEIIDACERKKILSKLKIIN